VLADLHLLRPYWLLALVPAVLLWLLLRSHRQQHSLWQNLIARHLQPVVLLGEQLKRQQPWALPILALCWLLAVLALSGPSWQKLPQPALAVKKATVLILDMSMSMRATDMVPDRLTQQRFKALDFVDKLREGDLALISYAAEAFVISPLTVDYNNIRLQIPNLKPELLPGQGSNVLHALQLADEVLRQAGYSRGEVMLFTDGFDQDSYHALQQLLNNYPHRLSILAFGQDEGAVVRLENGELLKNSQGAVVVPRVPLQQLSILAKQGGGEYQQAGADNSDLQALLSGFTQPNDTQDNTEARLGDNWQDAAVYLVWLLLPLALWLGRRSAVLLVCLLVYLPPAEAVSWRDLWQNKQQQAIADYQQGDFSAAQQKFTDPLWQGNAAYRAGDYAKAASAFQQALSKQPNAAAWQNLGNAQAMQQQFEQALSSYQQALELEPDNENARKNAELMQQLLKEQQQQEQQQQQNQQPQQDQQDQQGEQQSAEQNQSAEQGEAEPQQADNTQTQQDAAPEAGEEQAKQQPRPASETNEGEQLPEESQPQRQIAEPWPNATPEQQQQLENLLRKVQDDPGLLLRNRMLLEQQKRRTAPPPGAQQEW
jgi:Ca-activated chloride channel family protein